MTDGYHVSEHDALLQRLEPARLIVVCGAGGVGKTTVSATLGLARATAGERVVVLTIDPAKRLADALGVTLAGDPRAIEFDGVAPGHFNAAMLDPHAAFERVVDELNVRPADRERLRASRLTRELTTGVAGMQELMAVVELERLARGGHYDTIVLDTPPALHVLDLLDAPGRIAGLLAGRTARMVGRASGFAARLGNLPGPGRALGPHLGPGDHGPLHRRRRGRAARLRRRGAAAARGLTGQGRSSLSPERRKVMPRSVVSRASRSCRCSTSSGWPPNRRT